VLVAQIQVVRVWRNRERQRPEPEVLLVHAATTRAA
jgi:hypothetical protein